MAWPRQWASARPPVTLTVGPFDGVANTLDVADVDPGKLSHLYNGYFVRGGQVVGMRPQYVRRVLGGGAARWHALHFHTTSDGTTRLFGVRGSTLYRINTTTWALTDVTPAATTLTAPVYLHSFGDELIVAGSGVRPWRGSNLGSTPITRTNIEVDSAATAWSAYGAPTTYSAKLVFVRNDDRTKFVWSEEGAAGTGYEQTGYSNYWDFAQTSQEPITRVYGTNDALLVFRERSTARVLGAMESTFSSDGTHDGVSPSVGMPLPATNQPGAITRTSRGVWFVGADDFAYLIPPGGVPERIPNLSPTTAINTDSSYGFAFPLVEHGLVAFSATSVVVADSGLVAVVDDETGRCVGAWGSSLCGNPTAAAYVSGFQVIGDDNGTLVTIDGNTAGSAISDLNESAVATGISLIAVLPPFATSPARVVRGRELQVRWRDSGSQGQESAFLQSVFSVDYQTSERTTSTAVTVTLTQPGTSRTQAARVGLGADAQGRWVRFRVRHLSTDTTNFFGLVDATLRGVVVDDRGAR